MRRTGTISIGTHNASVLVLVLVLHTVHKELKAPRIRSPLLAARMTPTHLRDSLIADMYVRRLRKEDKPQQLRAVTAKVLSIPRWRRPPRAVRENLPLVPLVWAIGTSPQVNARAKILAAFRRTCCMMRISSISIVCWLVGVKAQVLLHHGQL